MLCLVTQLCLTLWIPWTVAYQPPLSMAILQIRTLDWSGLPCPPPGDLPNVGIDPGLPHCRKILYHLSHQGSPRTQELGSLSLLQGIFPTQELNWGLLHGYVVVIVKKGLSCKLQCSEFNCNGICLSIFSFLKYFGSRIIMLFFWLKSKSSFPFSKHTFITFNSFLYTPFYLISMLLVNLLITPLGLTRVALPVNTAVKL